MRISMRLAVAWGAFAFAPALGSDSAFAADNRAATIKPTTGVISVVNTNGPKPQARYYVAALGGYLTGPNTQISVSTPSDSIAAQMRVVVRNLATNVSKVAPLSGAGRSRSLTIDGYGPCPAGLDIVLSATKSQIPTGHLYEVSVYGPAEMPDPAKAPKPYLPLGVIKGSMTTSRNDGLRWFDPATPPDGGANWKPDLHKAIDAACCDPIARPGPEPWPEPEPSSKIISP